MFTEFLEMVEHEEEEERGTEQSLGVAVGDIDVDGMLGEPGSHRFEGGDGETGEDAEDNVPLVGAQVTDEPPHEAVIVCFTEYFFVVHVLLMAR